MLSETVSQPAGQRTVSNLKIPKRLKNHNKNLNWTELSSSSSSSSIKIQSKNMYLCWTGRVLCLETSLWTEPDCCEEKSTVWTGTSAATPQAAMRSERLFCALFYFSRVSLWYKSAIKSSSGPVIKWQRSRRIDFQLVTGGPLHVRERRRFCSALQLSFYSQLQGDWILYKVSQREKITLHTYMNRLYCFSFTQTQNHIITSVHHSG